MHPGSVFLIQAPIAIGFAIPLVLVPADFLWLYGAQPDASTVLLARLVGAALAAFAAMGWLAREAPEGPAVDALCCGLAIASGVGLLAALYHQLTDARVSALGWSTVALLAGFFAAYAALWLGRAARRRQPGLQAG
jgi:hypothetical protein